MARLCDIIESFIKKTLSDAEGVAEIQRNELANRFNCVPSQINYVISTRFTHGRGYYVESRRGGGGFIRISRVNVGGGGAGGYLMHIVSSLGEVVSQRDAEALICNLVDYEAADENAARAMLAALNDRALGRVAQPERDALRADILRNILTAFAR